MDFGRAFSEVVNDRDVLWKLSIVLVLTLLSALFPLGLVAAALLLGYQVDIIQAVRGGNERPLPGWGALQPRLNTGAAVLTAWTVYNLPNLLWLCFLSSMLFSSSTGTLTVMCCTLPVLLVINVATIPLHTLGLTRYAASGRIGAFFEIDPILDTLRANLDLFLQWFVLTIFLYTLMGIAAAIPCIGWTLAAALFVPVNAHLLGQLAAGIDGAAGKPKRG